MSCRLPSGCRSVDIPAGLVDRLVRCQCGGVPGLFSNTVVDSVAFGSLSLLCGSCHVRTWWHLGCDFNQSATLAFEQWESIVAPPKRKGDHSVSKKKGESCVV